MANGMIQMLYESAKSDSNVDSNGIPKFDEAKLRRNLEANKKLGARNKDVFANGEKRFKTCPRYNPCPICDKCSNKASHLYVSCQECKIPICTHTYEDKNRMIKRSNFSIPVSEEVMAGIKELAQAVTNENRD